MSADHGSPEEELSICDATCIIISVMQGNPFRSPLAVLIKVVY